MPNATLTRATIVAFDAATYTATVLLDGSLAEVSMAVLESVPLNFLAADDTVAVLLFQETNFENGVILGPFESVAGSPRYAGLNVGTYASAGGGDIRASGGLYVGRDADPGDGNVAFAGALKSYKNATEYTGYAYVPLTTPLTSTSFDGDAFSDTAKTLIDLSAVFGVPAGVKAVDVMVRVNDSGSAANDTYLHLGPTNDANIGKTFKPMPINDRRGTQSAIVPCDSNGDIYYQVEASGAGTFDVVIEIWGYWI